MARHRVGQADFPATLGTSFDFVRVDGRARSLCVREGFELLRPGGVLVMQDAQRVLRDHAGGRAFRQHFGTTTG